MTDSKPLLESIDSTRQIETKMLRPVVKDTKEKLQDGSISKFEWLEIKEIGADFLTKDKSRNRDMEEIVENNRLGAEKSR